VSAKKGKEYSGPLIILEKSVFETREFSRLSGNAVKVLIRIALGYDRYNNGRLSFTAREAEWAGFKSKDVVNKARDELLHTGWLKITRQGGRNAPTLYALTWRPVNYDDGLLCEPPLPRSDLWRDGMEQARETRGVAPRRSARGFAHRSPSRRTGQSVPRHTGKRVPPHGAT
jgi:hypothetical protein